MTNSEHLKDKKVVELVKALARAYLENGENEKAVEKFWQLVSQHSDDRELLLNYAIALARTECTSEEALKVYGKAINNEPDDENLHLNLATLFLKKEVTTEPALRVFRRSLSFSPPFEDQIRTALEKIFQETTETITVPEIRQTLLDCIDNPELLSLFLSTAWRDKRFDETLQILRELYLKSNKNALYLEAICHTLLEKKASAEEIGQYFILSPAYAQYCLKHRDIQGPIARIREFDSYLDTRNLFLALRRGSAKPQDDEYEFFLLEKTIEEIDEVTETANLPLEIQPGFSLTRDLLERIQTPSRTTANETPNASKTQLERETNTLAIFEISNFDHSPETSRLPFQTFIQLISNDLVKTHGMTLYTTRDGMVALGTNPAKMLHEAIDILDKLERYNQVVEEFELIELRATLHCSPIPFQDLEHQGIREIRKAFKIHNLTLTPNTNGTDKAATSGNIIRVSDEISNQVSKVKLNRLGAFRLPFFPHEHVVYEVMTNGPAKDTQPSRSKQYGKYEITETLKQNSLGATYRGYDPQLERSVIIKTYHTKALTAFKQFATLKKQFYEEIRNLNRINQPNISVIYDAGEQADCLYFVREYIEGTSLRQHLSKQKQLPAGEILELFIRICKVLATYHQSQVWHRNLRPDNVFLMAHNDVKLVDGGMLQLWYTDEIRIEEVEVLAYTSPEQIQRVKLTQSCDIFQLATLLYESLTTLNPFRADSAATVRMKILVDDPRPVCTVRSDLPAQLNNLLAKALSKNPDKRHASIKEFESELKQLISSQETQSKGRMYETIK
ncbi:MAG: protein kinase [bacterium]